MAQDTYQRPDIEQQSNGEIHIRASAIGGCYRRLWYLYWGEEPTDTRPRSTQNRLTAGTLLEEVIIEDLEESGDWQIEAWKDVPKTSDVLEYPIIDNLIATGTPDALGFHKKQNEWLPLELKTRAPIVFNETKRNGNVVRHPDAVAQLAVYHHALVNNGFVNPKTDSAIATMNIVNGEVYTEYFSAETMATVMDRLFQIMDTFVYKTLPVEEPPPRPFESSSWQCRGCPLRTHCWGFTPEGRPREQIPYISDNELAAQFAIWEDAKVLDKYHEINEDLDKHTKQMFRDFLNKNESAKMKIAGRTGTWNVSIRRRGSEDIDHDLLRYLLTPEQVADVVKTKETFFIDIRRGRG